MPTGIDELATAVGRVLKVGSKWGDPRAKLLDGTYREVAARVPANSRSPNPPP